MLRGTLQYRGDDDKWHTVTEGAAVSTPYGNAWEMKNTKADLAAKRWRIHNWRGDNNQFVDGIDLVVSTCQKNCPGQHGLRSGLGCGAICQIVPLMPVAHWL